MNTYIITDIDTINMIKADLIEMVDYQTYESIMIKQFKEWFIYLDELKEKYGDDYEKEIVGESHSPSEVICELVDKIDREQLVRIMKRYI